MLARSISLLAGLCLWSGLALAQLDINSATREQLDGLKGIGPVKAQAIVDYRRQHGPFRSVDELTQVPGLGPALVDGFRRDVTVGPQGRAAAAARPAAAPRMAEPAARPAEARTTLGTKPLPPGSLRPSTPAAANDAQPPAAPPPRPAMPRLSPAEAAKPPAVATPRPPAPERPASPSLATQGLAPAGPAVPANKAAPHPAHPQAPAPAEEARPAAPARPAMPPRPVMPANAH